MIINWIGRLLGPNGSDPVGGAEPLAWNASRAEAPSPLGSLIDSPDLLKMELERARRYERGLSIVVLAVELLSESRDADDASDGDGRLRGAGPPQMVSLVAAAGLREMVRQSDVLCYQATENRFVLALAESSADEARHALTRIRTILRERLELSIRAGIARFPDDALTLPELIAEAAPPTPAIGDGNAIVARAEAPVPEPPSKNGDAPGRVATGPGRASEPVGDGDGSRALGRVPGGER